jgi:hypothetical protein
MCVTYVACVTRQGNTCIISDLEGDAHASHRAGLRHPTWRLRHPRLLSLDKLQGDR